MRSFAGTDKHTTNPATSHQWYVRILFLYVGSLAIVMMLCPWKSIDPSESPFVLVLRQAGFAAAAGPLMLVAISAFFSSSNTGLYGSSRVLHALSFSGDAPFSTANRKRDEKITSGSAVSKPGKPFGSSPPYCHRFPTCAWVLGVPLRYSVGSAEVYLAIARKEEFIIAGARTGLSTLRPGESGCADHEFLRQSITLMC